MRNNYHGFAHLLLIIVIVVGIAGLVFISWQKGLIKIKPTQEISPTPIYVDETLKWNIYENKKFNYQLKYPPTYLIESGPGASSTETIDKLTSIGIYPPTGMYPDNNLAPVFYIEIFSPNNLPEYSASHFDLNYHAKESYDLMLKKGYKTGKLELRNINGKNAYVINFENSYYTPFGGAYFTDPYEHSLLILEHNGNIIHITYSKLQEFDQILSTFEFLEEATNNNIVKLPDSETYAYVNRLSVLTSGQDIKEAIDRYQGEIKTAIEETGSYEVEFPVDSLVELDEIKEKLNSEGLEATYSYVLIP